ncbi:glycosyltransferase family 2 protein, partial [Candidatus Parcubacteria bacterium]|nr:glycosyltransferase family 2 protein [Candidatus Parcubacteria bacterium]
KFIEALEGELVKISGHEIHLLVVDGNSPDGTAEIVRQKAKRYPNVHLYLEKEKAGLGAAYRYGMTKAIEDLGAEVIFEMDADFQHDPADVGRLLQAIDNGADVAIGSRFVEGGSIPREWAFKRKFFSIFGNIFARAVLGMWKVHDLTTGFRASKTEVLKKIDFKKFFPKGYAYKVQLIHELYFAGAKITEVPINFAEREEGESKMVGGARIVPEEAVNELKVVLALRWERSQRFIKFALVGGLGLLLQTIVFELFRGRIGPDNAAAVGGELAIISNFIWNNLWTFRDRALTRRRILPKFLQFNLTSLVAIAIQWLVIHAGVALWGPGLWIERLYFAVSLVLVIIWNYTIYNKLIWRKKQ